jgi:hypothetical protein
VLRAMARCRAFGPPPCGLFKLTNHPVAADGFQSRLFNGTLSARGHAPLPASLISLSVYPILQSGGAPIEIAMQFT